MALTLKTLSNLNSPYTGQVNSPPDYYNQSPAPKPAAPSNQGVYWIGADGNVYVKGSQGTNAAGRADANTNSYWTSRGYGQIADPNPPKAGGGAPATSAYYDPYAAQRAAEAAAEAQKQAQLTSLRGDVTGIINNIKGTYDSIFGTAQGTAAEQNNKLTSDFAKTASSINDTANTGAQQVGAAYTARGVGDSSYNSNQIDTVKKAAQTQLQQAGDELSQNQASIGQFLAQQEATRNAQKSSLDSILSHIAETTDPGELTSLRNTLTARLADLQSSAADVQSNKTYLANLAKTTPEGDRINALQSTLSAIIGGSADASLKKSVGLSFIQNSGLSDDAQKQLIAQLNNTIDAQINRSAPAAPPAPAQAQ